MPRLTVWVPDDVYEAAMEAAPDLNKSAVMQAGLRSVLECEHHDLTCSTCGHTTTSSEVAGPRLTALFISITNRLRERLDQPGYQGASQIVRTIASSHGVPGVAMVPVLRSNRAQYEAQRDAAFAAQQEHDAEPAAVLELPLEADSRHRHPTAKEATA